MKEVIRQTDVGGHAKKDDSYRQNTSILTKPTLKFVFLKPKWQTRHT